MNQICGSQFVPPTEKAAKYVLIMKVMIVLQVIIAIADIVAARAFLR